MQEASDVDETLKIVFLGDSGESPLSRRGEDDHPSEVYYQELRAVHAAHYRLHVLLQEAQEGRQGLRAAGRLGSVDMGYSRAREVPVHGASLLQGRQRSHTRLRCHKPEIFQLDKGMEPAANRPGAKAPV